MDTHELMHKIDEILYGEHKQPYSTGDQLTNLIVGCIQEAYKKGYTDGGVAVINDPDTYAPTTLNGVKNNE